MSSITQDYTDVPVSQPLPMATQQGADIWYEPGVKPPEGRYDVWLRTGDIDRFYESLYANHAGDWEDGCSSRVLAWRRRRFFPIQVTKPPWLSGTGRLPDDDGWYRGSLKPTFTCDHEVWITGVDGSVLYVECCSWSGSSTGWALPSAGSQVLAWRFIYKKSLLLSMPEWVANYKPEPDAAGWLPGHVLPVEGGKYDVYLVFTDATIHISDVVYTKEFGWMGLPYGVRKVNAWRPTRDRAKPAWLP